MNITCQNCQQHFRGNYCNHCGQPADTHRITLHFLWHDIQHGILHVDKGLLFTVKELFTRPGNSIREFIEGRRFNHFKPISLIIVLAGICGFLYQYYHINILAANVKITSDGDISHAQNILTKATEWFAEHYALISIMELPLFATGTFIAFKKAGYNLTEHLVLNAFLTGQRLILHIATFPLYYIYNNTPTLSVIEKCVTSAGTIIMVLSLMQFFNQQKKLKSFLLSLLSLLIFGLIALGLVTLIAKILFRSET